MNLKKNDEYEVEIIDITLDGQGVAKIDGITVFVANTATGDIAKIKIVKVLKSYAFGILLNLITPSPDRCDFDCEVYEKCGGCAFRHISYEAELKLKQKAVEDAFNRIGKINQKSKKIVGSQDANFYRNKAQYPIGTDENGLAYSGFYAKRSHRIVKCYNCNLQPEIFGEILRETIKFLNENKIPAYDETNHKGLIRHLYLRQAEHTKEIMLTLVATKPDFDCSEIFAKHITQKFSDIKTVIVNYNPNKTNVILGEKCKTILGSGYIEDKMCGVDVRISPLAFYQVNKLQAQRIYQKAVEYANLSLGDTLLDLYCGIGTIGLSAAKKVGKLIGVEVVKQAVVDAKYNAKLNNAGNAEFISADCNEAVADLKSRGIAPDVIIIDPPRKGCDADVINAIADFAPSRVVMVSCNPATAARDCALLQERGYLVREYTPYDLFPRTSHVECVVILSREFTDKSID